MTLPAIQQWLLILLDIQPHEWIADVCAAPGGKASAILEQVGPGSGFLLANEPIRGRLPALEFNLARVGFPGLIPSSWTTKYQVQTVRRG